MRRFLDTVLKINKWMRNIGGLALTFIVALTTADVVLRACGRPILGTYEIVAICGGIVIGFTIPLTSWVKGHIAVDFAVNTLSDKGKKVVTILTRCVAIGLCLMISWNILKIGTSFRTGGEVSNTLQLPLYPVAYGIAVCFFVLSVVLFCDILRIFEGGNE